MPKSLWHLYNPLLCSCLNGLYSFGFCSSNDSAKSLFTGGDMGMILCSYYSIIEDSVTIFPNSDVSFKYLLTESCSKSGEQITLVEHGGGLTVSSLSALTLFSDLIVSSFSERCVSYY